MLAWPELVIEKKVAPPLWVDRFCQDGAVIGVGELKALDQSSANPADDPPS